MWLLHIVRYQRWAIMFLRPTTKGKCSPDYRLKCDLSIIAWSILSLKGHKEDNYKCKFVIIRNHCRFSLYFWNIINRATTFCCNLDIASTLYCTIGFSLIHFRLYQHQTFIASSTKNRIVRVIRYCTACPYSISI